MKCWALKTRGDYSNRREFMDYWERFVGGKVVAIGWKLPGIPISTASKEEIIAELKKDGPAKPRELTAAANTILKFRDEIDVGDNILLCRGYAALYPQKVRLYGIASIDGGLFEDRNSDWWWYKRSANIQKVFGTNGIDVPRGILARILGKGSLLQTLHEIDCSALDVILKRFAGLNTN